MRHGTCCAVLCRAVPFAGLVDQDFSIPEERKSLMYIQSVTSTEQLSRSAKGKRTWC